MFAGLFLELRQAKVPVSLREYLTLLEAMKHNLASYSVDDFYYLARAALVKDERNLDKFDRVFGHHFKGLETVAEAGVEIPEEWLRKLAEKLLTEEEKKQIAAMGGWDRLMEELKKRLAEQQGRHQGGSKWIGTAGTSPYGAYGYNPEGVRIGQDENRNNRAVKVWDKREFKNLDDRIELGTRNIKVALRRLRQFAREGAQRRLARHQDGAGASQRGEGAAAARHRRLDGRPCAHLRGAVLGGARRVQAPRIFLFPQLPLRVAVARRVAPPGREDADAAGAAHLRCELQADLRRRRQHEPLRDRPTRCPSAIGKARPRSS